ncbi:MAG: transcriptional repressor [Arsenicicoccus sp.]|uniref:Fur family transcriptional regulator n=1 Tax=Serinicoccus profundi TaxID=1078471 RepID=UPI000255E7AB|nr:Fur family transcriptional regulator [Serinicoccus profundi]PZU43328.1 MAG: transcriptional repressor [Arsenicicoccus sp.]
MTSTTAPPAAALRAAGLRVTSPRLAVLDTLERHPHVEAAEVVHLTRARHQGVSVQGVYDVLAALTAARLVRRIEPAHAVARYELDRGDNHHHVVCRDCDVLVDVPCPVGSAPCLDPAGAQSLGFTVDEAEVIYWGRCPQCQNTTDSTTKEKP